MQNEFTAVIERDGEWFVAWCPEIPEANGQGKTIEDCRENLSQAISLVLEDRREDAMRGVPASAVRELIRSAASSKASWLLSQTGGRLSLSLDESRERIHAGRPKA